MQPDLATLPTRVAEAVSADELEQATRFAGATRNVDESRLRVTLELDAPADARELCGAWGIEGPVAVSGDVHQHSWSVLVAGDELPDPHGSRIASAPLTAGRWQLVPRLAQRPAGELPGVSSGASPAYDIHERGGEVVSIEIRPVPHTVVTDADPERLLAQMRATYPAWHDGWRIDPRATFVTIDDAAGAALTDLGDGVAQAAQVSLVDRGLGPALLDALEAIARERGFARLRLSSSAFLYGDDLPYERYAYVVGPAYDGDADVEVWAEKELASSASGP